MRQLYFRNAFVSLYYDKVSQYGEAVWVGELYGAEFRESTLLCLDLIDRLQLQRWLGDNRNMKSINPADLKWALEVFVPQLLEGPLLRMANLPSVYEGNREAIEVMKEKINPPNQQLIIKDFFNKDEAVKWLFE